MASTAITRASTKKTAVENRGKDMAHQAQVPPARTLPEFEANNHDLVEYFLVLEAKLEDQARELQEKDKCIAYLMREASEASVKADDTFIMLETAVQTQEEELAELSQRHCLEQESLIRSHNEAVQALQTELQAVRARSEAQAQLLYDVQTLAMDFQRVQRWEAAMLSAEQNQLDADEASAADDLPHATPSDIPIQICSHQILDWDEDLLLEDEEEGIDEPDIAGHNIDWAEVDRRVEDEEFWLVEPQAF